jgi:hypothetical protein
MIRIRTEMQGPRNGAAAIAFACAKAGGSTANCRDNSVAADVDSHGMGLAVLDPAPFRETVSNE